MSKYFLRPPVRFLYLQFFFCRTSIEKAERNGLGEVFQAIKEDNCVIFDCETVIK